MPHPRHPWHTKLQKTHSRHDFVEGEDLISVPSLCSSTPTAHQIAGRHHQSGIWWCLSGVLILKWYINDKLVAIQSDKRVKKCGDSSEEQVWSVQSLSVVCPRNVDASKAIVSRYDEVWFTTKSAPQQSVNFQCVPIYFKLVPTFAFYSGLVEGTETDSCRAIESVAIRSSDLGPEWVGTIAL